jgi:hypothetical protein
MKKQRHRPARANASRVKGVSDSGDDDLVEERALVGYKRPPKHTRFKPGQSGNPKGRPRGTRNFTTDVKATLKALVKVTRDGIPHRVSTQEAALLRLREKALSGDPRALDRLLAYAQTYGDEETTAEQVSADDERVLEVYRTRVLRSAVEGSPSDGNSNEARPTRIPEESNADSSTSVHLEQQRHRNGK